VLVDANEIDPTVGKMSALELLWEATWAFPISAKQIALDALLCLPGN
jgi:hypothetical protein